MGSSKNSPPGMPGGSNPFDPLGLGSGQPGAQGSSQTSGPNVWGLASSPSGAGWTGWGAPQTTTSTGRPAAPPPPRGSDVPPPPAHGPVPPPPAGGQTQSSAYSAALGKSFNPLDPSSLTNGVGGMMRQYSGSPFDPLGLGGMLSGPADALGSLGGGMESGLGLPMAPGGGKKSSPPGGR